MTEDKSKENANQEKPVNEPGENQMIQEKLERFPFSQPLVQKADALKGNKEGLHFTYDWNTDPVVFQKAQDMVTISSIALKRTKKKKKKVHALQPVTDEIDLTPETVETKPEEKPKSVKKMKDPDENDIPITSESDEITDKEVEELIKSEAGEKEKKQKKKKKKSKGSDEVRKKKKKKKKKTKGSDEVKEKKKKKKKKKGKATSKKKKKSEKKKEANKKSDKKQSHWNSLSQQSEAELIEFTKWLNSVYPPQAEPSSKHKKKQKDKKKKKKKGKNKSVIKSKIDQSVKSKEDILSENLAKLYADQGYYKKAIEMYEKLLLKNPEKSHFFAPLIEELKSKQ